MGFFNLMMGKDQEAVSLFKESRTGADTKNMGFQKELLFSMGMAMARMGDDLGAQEAYQAAIAPANAAQDWRKVMGANEWLAEQQIKEGDKTAARVLLNKAVEAADSGDLRDAQKGLRRKLEALA